MEITIKIYTDNDALTHHCDFHNVECPIVFNIFAVREILNNIAEDISSTWWQETGTNRRLLDENGNTIGYIETRDKSI